MSMFEEARFIECPPGADGEPAPLFRRCFTVPEKPLRAMLAICGLGYGCAYLNGKAVSEDLFIAPVSDYRRTLWYTIYDVTVFVQKGDNVFAAILGNGFYNESLHTVWGMDRAPWRAEPKLIVQLELEYDGRTETLVSDESWLCCREQSPVRYNQLRSGMVYDARYPADWNQPGFDDTGWPHAAVSLCLPGGVFRECLCPPVREDRLYPARRIFRNADGDWVVDFGQNLSGYIRLSVCIPEGNTLIVRYTEELFADGTRNLSNMDAYYYGCDFQTDRLIGSGKPLRWSPLFVYHGFRYVILHGLEQPPEPADISAVFVHQMVEELSSFSCSDETINRLYACGKMATLSNLFYMPTDCPQREKLGWTNDAQASAEQMLQNFAVAPLFLKWLQDILDAMTDEGVLPGIVPSHGWGYENVDGPVSSGILFELPVQVYRATGDDAAIRLAYPAMQKHLAYMAGRADPQDGLLDYGLCDWAGPFERPELAPTPKKLTHTLLLSKFFGMTAMAAGVLGHGAERKRYEELAQVWREKARAAFIGKDGRCTVEEQTGVAMLIALGAYRQLEPLKAQLRTLLEARGYHHHCGMLGMQYLFPALDICGMQEEAYRVITVPGRPSYTEWLEHDATTMWEMWHTGDSKNHHMYSCVLSWFMKTLVGLRQAEGSAGWQEAVIAPYFLSALTSCRGVYRTAGGTFMVEWNRQDGGVRLCIQVPQGVRTLLVLPDNMTVKEAAGQTAVLPAGRSVWLCHIKEDEL